MNVALDCFGADAQVRGYFRVGELGGVFAQAVAVANVVDDFLGCFCFGCRKVRQVFLGGVSAPRQGVVGDWVPTGRALSNSKGVALARGLAVDRR